MTTIKRSLPFWRIKSVFQQTLFETLAIQLCTRFGLSEFFRFYLSKSDNHSKNNIKEQGKVDEKITVDGELETQKFKDINDIYIVSLTPGLFHFRLGCPRSFDTFQIQESLFLRENV